MSFQSILDWKWNSSNPREMLDNVRAHLLFWCVISVRSWMNTNACISMRNFIYLFKYVHIFLGATVYRQDTLLTILFIYTSFYISSVIFKRLSHLLLYERTIQDVCYFLRAYITVERTFSWGNFFNEMSKLFSISFLNEIPFFFYIRVKH